jgi:hypothetical protein
MWIAICDWAHVFGSVRRAGAKPADWYKIDWSRLHTLNNRPDRQERQTQTDQDRVTNTAQHSHCSAFHLAHHHHPPSSLLPHHITQTLTHARGAVCMYVLCLLVVLLYGCSWTLGNIPVMTYDGKRQDGVTWCRSQRASTFFGTRYLLSWYHGPG